MANPSRLFFRYAWRPSVTRYIAAGTLAATAGCSLFSPEPPAHPTRIAPFYPSVPFSQTSPGGPPPSGMVQQAQGLQSDAAQLPSPTSAGIVPPEMQLDLGTALRLAGVENPTINLAAEQIRESLAAQLQARVLLLPNLNIGGNYHYNNGPVQSSTGQIINVSDQSLYAGFGAGTIGSMSVAYPGIWLYAQLDNALYEPLAARETVVARRSNSSAVQIAVLGDVAAAYLRLVGAEARLAELRRSDEEGRAMVKITTDFVEARQGRPADMNRAASFDDLVERQRIAAQGDVDIAAARLCRLLNLDPSLRVRPAVTTIEPFRLIPEETDETVLIDRALQVRPELVVREANIREAQVRVRQERVRPLLPTVSVGLSAGAFGGASDLYSGTWTQLAGRTDFDVMLVWNLQNLGLGNRARVKAATAIVGEARADYETTRNQVRTEVVEALAATRSAARQMVIARSALDTAAEAFRLDLERVKGGGGIALNAARPIELLDSFQELLDARLALVDAITNYDVTQVRLFAAVGSNPLAGPDIGLAVPTAIQWGRGP